MMDATCDFINDTVPETSGTYRCEVSAEETFETDFREMNITISSTFFFFSFFFYQEREREKNKFLTKDAKT